MNVVEIGDAWEMLAEWGKVRKAILAGSVKGFQASFLDDQGRDGVYLGGLYKDDPQLALKAALRMSAARMLTEDPPLILRASE